MSKDKGTPQRANGEQPAPSFYKSQLVRCKRLGASPDVIEAALHDGKAYTLAQAKAEIKKFLTRKA